MTYDDWKTRVPADEGVACRKCRAEEAERGSWFCKDCAEEQEAEQELNP